jgi:hypothetical protein
MIIAKTLLAEQKTPSAVLACDLEAIGAAERRRYSSLTHQLKAAVLQQRELPDGFAWELDEKKLSFVEAAEWITFERRCCPFLTLQLEATGNHTGYWVNLQGPAGVKAFLVAEFGPVTR